MTHPINLYFDAHARTRLRYWAAGAPRERVLPCPAALLMAPPDPEAEVTGRVLTTPHEALFHAFRTMPLRPELDWTLAPGEAFTPLWRTVFDKLLEMLRRPPEARWCVRGEPGWFLQFGLREADGSYTMAALVLPNGKPAVLTFRAEDLIEALSPPRPFAEMEIVSQADGLPAQTDRVPWDTRVRLPIATPGAALLSFRLIG